MLAGTGAAAAAAAAAAHDGLPNTQTAIQLNAQQEGQLCRHGIKMQTVSALWGKTTTIVKRKWK